MGIPLDIYILYRLQREEAGCEHFLLLKVERPGFRNAIEPEYEAAIATAEHKQAHLLSIYQTQVLPHECPGKHLLARVGELQSRPVGEELLEDGGGFYVELWVAETRFGHPWVVMGTARNEEEFWQRVEEDEDLVSLGAIRPAVKRRVWFLTEHRKAG
ncbi:MULTISPECIES: hypothetical protein [unclassified Leptolyngbya]|uniref:hypothetical protein n=1 Tax=unclassified Leptolyngbya TaxID=2650499 RepID=UPI001683674E|nr:MULTISPECIES: hypothetical protein [unclassified Leptolyngbya]MBD1911659.1 hypothetical protein [Leptolyngbya sp. FACHB-8]MBD2154602.1 hypothetical protein [Leptolyngbya sp. FACHB-16]